jgi:cytochrome c oxidase subunit II
VHLPRRRLLAAGAAAVGVGLPGIALLRAGEPERVIHVVARRFVFLPNEITLKQGEPVVLELTAPEVVMGFSVPELNVRADIIPGQPARVRLVPERAGSFAFLCDIFCGDGHEGMNGMLHVVA